MNDANRWLKQAGITDDPPARITIEPSASRGDRGQSYRVWYGDAVLIEATWNPEFDAARALLARGITGRFEAWRQGKSYVSMHGDIETAAKLTIVENATEGPRIANWVPLPENAFCARRGEPHTAKSASPVPTPTPERTPPEVIHQSRKPDAPRWQAFRVGKAGAAP